MPILIRLPRAHNPPLFKKIKLTRYNLCLNQVHNVYLLYIKKLFLSPRRHSLPHATGGTIKKQTAHLIDESELSGRPYTY
ncbi:hypothetical protein [Desulfosporosinus acidiphilus]|uniref:hypothetical protein n=1 Tax=Desulfosporosinus acidiphilus TaxID=885581 RepID=UPI001A9A4914|nr:hypothetical protein [Desulfosporosinus acidiphilus]